MSAPERNKWSLFRAIKGLGDETTPGDEAGRFVQIFDEVCESETGSIPQGALSKSEQSYWQRKGLIAKGVNGGFVFTEKAEIVAERIRNAENFVHMVRKLNVDFHDR